MDLNSPMAFLRLVRMSGEDGAEWVQEFERRAPVVELCRASVEVLRRQRHEEGADLLERARRDLAALGPGAEPSVRAALERWYHAAMGFYFYVHDAWDEADGSMERAAEAVAAAIERRRCLMVMAMACHEFRLHRARIARKRRDWRAMRLHAETGAAMRAGHTPFCTLRDGTPIGLADIQRYYRAVPAPTPDDEAAVQHFTDGLRAQREAEFALRLMFCDPGFVIQYP